MCPSACPCCPSACPCVSAHVRVAGMSMIPSDSENSFRQRQSLVTTTIPGDSENPFENPTRPYDNENPTRPYDNENPLQQREYLPTARISSDSDNPWRQRQSLRQQEQRRYHGGSYASDSDNPYDSENPWQQRESLATATISTTARIPRRIPPLRQRQSQATATILTTATILMTATILTTATIPGNNENTF